MSYSAEEMSRLTKELVNKFREASLGYPAECLFRVAFATVATMCAKDPNIKAFVIEELEDTIKHSKGLINDHHEEIAKSLMRMVKP